MKKNLIILLFIFLPGVMMAQKKELSEARTNIKKGVNLDKAENSMRNLLKDSTNLQNEKIWLTLYDAVKKQYEQLNEKLYLKQQSDTAKFLTHTIHMFDVLENLDSVDVVNTNGKPVYRKKHALLLNQNRKNVFNGGAYYLQKQKFSEASAFFAKYIACADMPLFSEYDYNNTDSTSIIEAAYWMTFCGYKLRDAAMIDAYADMALRNPSREVLVMQYQAESAFIKNDLEKYVQILNAGFDKYPTNAYFFPHLATYYVQNDQHEDILRTCKRVLDLDENHLEALHAYSTSLLATSQYDKCIEASDKLIKLTDQFPRAFLNAGTSYFRKADKLFAISVPNAAQKAELEDLCTKAMPYLERYREMCPEDTNSYASALYNIYLTLNNGEGFEEMEQILYGE